VCVFVLARVWYFLFVKLMPELLRITFIIFVFLYFYVYLLELRVGVINSAVLLATDSKTCPALRNVGKCPIIFTSALHLNTINYRKQVSILFRFLTR
jgi:hypothetical protein